MKKINIKNDILFKNETKYTQKEYEIFLDVYQKEFEVSECVYSIVYFIFLTICLILSLFNKLYLLSVFLILTIIIYIWYKFIRPNQFIEKERKSDKFRYEYINEYTFYKRYFCIENKQGKATILYFKLYRVVETKTNFYLFIDRNYALIILKNSFLKGNAEDFSKFIKRKTGLKYKNKYV